MTCWRDALLGDYANLIFSSPSPRPHASNMVPCPEVILSWRLTCVPGRAAHRPTIFGRRAARRPASLGRRSCAFEDGLNAEDIERRGDLYSPLKSGPDQRSVPLLNARNGSRCGLLQT